MKIKGYTIESTSDEGIYYLVNGWNKNRKFWINKNYVEKAIFQTIGQAKASLTKLLKIMEDYKTDTFRICEITENNEINYIEEIRNNEI